MTSTVSEKSPRAGARALRRLITGLFGALAIAAPIIAAAQAQTAPKAEGALVIELKGGEKSEDVARMVDALRRDGKPVTLRFADPAAQPAPAQPLSVTPPAAQPSAAAPSSSPGFLAMLLEAFRLSGPSLKAIPPLGPDFIRAWTTNGGAGAFWLALLAATALGVGAGFLTHRTAARALALHEQRCTAKTSGRMALSLRRLTVDIAATVATVVVFKLLSDWWIDPNRLTNATEAAMLKTIVVFAVYLIIGRFLLSPGHPEARLLRIPRADLHFRIFLIYVITGQACFFMLAMADATASRPIGVSGLYLVVSTAFTIYKTWWFWIGRNDIAALILSGAEKPDAPGLLRRLFAIATPGIYIALGVAIWLVSRVAGMMHDGARWAWAAGATQFLIVLIPIIAVGAAHLIRDLHHRAPDEEQPPPLRKAFGVVGEQAAAGLVWVAGLVAMAHMWGDFFMESGSQMIVTQIRNLTAVVAVAIVGYLIWAFFRALFDAHAPKRAPSLPSEEEEHEQVQSRIGSVLPLLRGFALGAIVGLTILVALSKLGVDIGPLLAGFGILGLAISFGSQALVRDIVSGLFFMVEDAFRVGEYIDTGRLRGTVEKISLRSVQLRHQSGQIHTIPFGQIASVTNASRDWATVKFNIKLDRTADIEKARKTIKKTGLAMLEDPEIGREFILPLKMQGVSDINETGIIVRLKFTGKPSQASYLQRESLKRVHRAFGEAGVPFASHAVTVMRGMDEMSSAAAASTSIGLAQRAAANAPAA